VKEVKKKIVKREKRRSEKTGVKRIEMNDEALHEAFEES
jgi:hypothetical protein